MLASSSVPRPAQPAFQFAQGRRQEKDVLPARERKVQLGRALNVDVEQDVLPGFQGFEHGGQRRPVIIAVHVGPFRENPASRRRRNSSTERKW